MQYFEMVDDVDAPNRWDLGEIYDLNGDTLNPWLFNCAKRQRDPGAIHVPIADKGTALDYTYAAFSVPIVTSRVREILMDCAAGEIQTFPARVGKRKKPYFVVNYLKDLWCVDESNSEFEKWQKHHERPDLLGHYRIFVKLRVDPIRAKETKVFRLGGFHVVVVVYEKIHDAFLKRKITGVKFRPV